MMTINEEIQNVAHALGKSLHDNDFIQSYLEALKEFESDPQAKELEQQLYNLYDSLISRQQAGEQLGQEEIQAFQELRRRVQTHPVISKRDTELRLVKPYLAEVADEISAELGIDYTTLARSE